MLHSIRVGDYMATQLVCVTPGMTIDQAIKVLLNHRISGAPVIENGELLGMFSESDCLAEIIQAGYYESNAGLVSDVMRAPVDTIHVDESILRAAEVFQREHRRRLPVVNDLGVVIGQISRRDILRAMDDLTHQSLAAHHAVTHMGELGS
ncbi:CBS domain-containing protein [Perlucidibaca piscinae]|uniref:CBS domain-containing protein n=1 Tax=Perlucidibaca piscinae TaxID=392589 RepID=UPI0003B57A63|nr:CBS domain-containing protein [Perlucidibaca piscinae]